MSLYKEVNSVITNAKNIVVLQADNPDGDSLGSSLALEAILSEMGKNVYMVCAVNIPNYLRHLPGWDRVEKEIPQNLDVTIIVDTSAESLFESFEKDSSFSWIKSKPVIVIDHHTQSSEMQYANITVNEEAAATGEVIYDMATHLGWPLPIDACNMIVASIMSDSLGLISDSASAKTIRIVSELVEKGVSLAKLDSIRRETSRKERVLLPYKGELLKRVNYDETGRIASIVIPWEEIEKFSPLYNPTMLVIEDMRNTVGVDVSIGYKVYPDGKITAKIRANYGKNIAAKLAAEFGGGGHEYAAGFKLTDGTKLKELKEKVNQKANELLDSKKDEGNYEII